MMQYIDIKDGTWIDALPDKSALPCSICGCRVDFIFMVDDFLWDRVVPKRHKLNVICLHCLDVLAVEKGENLCKYIEDIYYCGEEKTIDLFNRKTYHYKKCGHEEPIKEME